MYVGLIFIDVAEESIAAQHGSAGGYPWCIKCDGAIILGAPQEKADSFARMDGAGIKLRGIIGVVTVGNPELTERCIAILCAVNAAIIGEVDDVSEYYANSDIALVPLLEGSGTRLKILEAMSFGIPVVSTSIGAEGIDYSDGKNILIANGEEAFTKTIIGTLTQEDLMELISKNGLLLVQEKYDWVKIVKDVSVILKDFAQK